MRNSNGLKPANKLRLCLGVMAATLAIPAVASAATLTVNDNTTGPGPAGANCTVAATYTTIQAAVTAANPNDTIAVCAGTYAENVTVSKALIFQGAQAGVDARTGRTTTANESVVDAPGAQGFTINSPVTIDGFTFQDATQTALAYGSNPATSTQNIRNNVFTNNLFGTLGSFGNESVFTRNRVFGGNEGVDLNTQGASSVEITDNLFSGLVDSDIVFVGGGVTYNDAVISGNVHTSGPGAGNFAVLQNNDDTEITDNVISGTTSTSIYIGGGSNGTLVSGNTIAGGASTGVGVVNQFGYGPNSGTRVVGNTITGKLRAVRVVGGPPATTSDAVEVHFNRIVGNTNGIVNETGSGGSVDAENNYFGCNAGANTTGCDSTTGDVDATPNLVLRAQSTPSTILTGGATSAITADLSTNSAGQTPNGNVFPGGASVAFATTLGTLAPATDTLDGNAAAQTTLTSGATAGTATVTATLDSQSVTTPVTINAPAATTLPDTPSDDDPIVVPDEPAADCTSVIKGKKKADGLIGSSTSDLIKGRGGNDKIDGRGGRDCVFGGSGKDKIKATDGQIDQINCGGGKDRVKADANDVVASNCEKVKRKK